jgi:hypothetical protein
VAFQRLDLRFDHAEGTVRARLALTYSHDRIYSSPDNPDVIATSQSSHGVRLRGSVEQQFSPEWRVRAGGDASTSYVANDQESLEGQLVTYPNRTDLTAGGSRRRDVASSP